MRKKLVETSSDYRILIVDDEPGIIDSLSIMLKRSGYLYEGITDPLEAVEKVRTEHFDLMILDYLMAPIHGDEVVKRIRQFNSELYILLLTGHKDLAPPLETIKALDIQGYCEKSDRFDQLQLLVESGIKSITMMKTIKKFRDGLNRILGSVPKIYQLQPIGNILEEILAELLPMLSSKNAFILVDNIIDKDKTQKSIFRGIGKYKAEIYDFMSMLNSRLLESIGKAKITKQVIKTPTEIILPLLNEFGESIGVIYVESTKKTETDISEGYELLEIYAAQAASSINNAFLHSLVNIKNEELFMTYEQLRIRYLDTIEALRQVVDAKDEYTCGHSDRVSYYCVKIGEAFNLSEQELETLRVAGLFHDVGKMSIADDILFKREKLSLREYDEIKKHPTKGARILSVISMFKNVVPIVKCHHERIDGQGYPDGLKGEQIPFLARIVSVADAFDAMMSDRHYRSKLNLNAAINQLLIGSGTQFDSHVVGKFVGMLGRYAQMEKDIAYTFE
ncbi:MAG: HD domain-containing phosphohydrolase [Acetivibrionales bacterium]|jgi:putative nucleotidyltransferase with HDIG domain